ncbi:MAG: hypothetical protein NWP69_04940, partial [Congregibacter sp.]|nr:hypothetical protein [Congregibacter sp.]
MQANRSTEFSRYFDFRLGLGIPVALMVLLLLFDPSGLDFAIEHLFYQPGLGFIGKRHVWLEDILHDRAKQLVIVFGVLAIIGLVISLLPTRLRQWRRPLGFLVLALGLSTSIVTPLKALTGVQLLEAIDGDLITRLSTDPLLLGDVLFAICKPQADKQEITDESFGEGLAGNAIDDATNALLEA